MKKVIYETAMVANKDPQVFTDAVMKRVKEYQVKGYEVDIHFSTGHGTAAALIEVYKMED